MVNLAYVTDNKIGVLTLEITNKNDLKSSNIKKKEHFLSFNLLEKLIVENSSLKSPIKTFQIGGIGNPFLHKEIESILELLFRNKIKVGLTTNGLNLKKNIPNFDEPILRNIHFSLYLDHPEEDENNDIMGKNAFNKTIESMEYLNAIGLKYDILMRINSKNYNKIEEMLDLSKHYGCNLLLPIEKFPFAGNEKNILNDKEKREVIDTIIRLRSIGEPIFKSIHFENPENKCSYLRKERLFINSKNQLAFCHFLSIINNSFILNLKNKEIEELIKIDNYVRNEFLNKKDKEIKKVELPRKLSSPCSYCLRCMGVKEKW